MLRAQAHGSIDEIIVEATSVTPASGGNHRLGIAAMRKSRVLVEFRLRPEHVDALMNDLKKAKREIAERNKREGRLPSRPKKK